MGVKNDGEGDSLVEGGALNKPRVDSLCMSV
jgi:hypothetical protein